MYKFTYAFKFSQMISPAMQSSKVNREIFLRVTYLDQVTTWLAAAESGNEELAATLLTKMTRTATECGTLNAID